ncbi:MAG: hypothetical protein P3T54_07785 [Dehalogenimonas sp.]|uniref:Uncharacterized protein n=1 Tax=Candidatus Dehalogenimonas loeffleri TaxID=3127115 RepID=A0ABZ2J3R1_9CHLR|nr:hypothetical protein [Dehalogenimonas sp.]
MCCLVALLMLVGPRATIVIWWLFDSGRWSQAFDVFLIPVLGFIFLPWTTLAYVLIFSGGVTGLDVVLLIIAIMADLGSYGGGWRQRERISRR